MIASCFMDLRGPRLPQDRIKGNQGRCRIQSFNRQSISAPDALIMGAHFASSALTKSAAVSGVLPGVGSIPAFSSADETAGSASDLLMAALSLSTIGFGV